MSYVELYIPSVQEIYTLRLTIFTTMSGKSRLFVKCWMLNVQYVSQRVVP